MTLVEFGGLRIAYDDRLLTPRTWTQEQSRWARDLAATVPEGDVLELCAGAGQIGLLAVRDCPRRLVTVDLNPVAAAYIAHNGVEAGIADRLEIRTGRIRNMLKPGESFPLIIADPPWVSRAATSSFPADPRVAIDGGIDGLAVVRECVAAIVEHLAPGGVALLQLAPGDEQADAVASWLESTRLRAVERRLFERGTLLRIDA